NDTPILNSPITDQTINQNSNFSLNISNNFQDIDLGDSLTYSATLTDGQPLPSWLTFDPNTGEFTGIPANSDVGIINLKVIAKDNSNTTVEDNFQLTVSNINDTPILNSPITDQTINQNSNFSLN
ncbi:putative Ig domain-containing protein, partial [Planktothrix paucivesiculata]|uniref:putative Ig domain-containing protein n=1 Tax=Planktothrix paucivesiculata TaxID=1678308 RepID=UPI0012DF792C